ncbi:MAG: DegT/DnrJ/EryC1/StrS family aminotransferase [Gemmatimonadetes bacterium]|nr:DegT/DnrJ/EryC1/StrS family aminotransferase [Gemmatimonadota bacterium]
MEGGQPIRDTYLVFGRPLFSEEEIQDVVAVLRSGWPGMGKKTIEFEQAFAEYCGARHAVSIASCTAGLHVALLAAGVGRGDEVVTTAMTFAATINAIRQTGATPVLVDIDPNTLNLTPEAVSHAITPKTKAILPVHFGGLPCDLERLGELARSHRLAIIEDAAHAVGGVYHGRRVGGHGNLACFSFYPNKNMTTIEGGMITTDDDGLVEEMRLLRLHGLSSDAWKRFESKAFIPSRVVRDGFKYNMTDVQAVLGLGQLKRLEAFLATRERYAAILDEELAGLPFDRQLRPPLGGTDRHALHLYVILLRLEELTVDRDHILAAIREENIGVTAHYLAINEHPYYQRVLPYRPGDFPFAERVSARTLTLPMSPSMSEDDLFDVIDAVRSVLARYRVPAASAAAR